MASPETRTATQTGGSREWLFGLPDRMTGMVREWLEPPERARLDRFLTRSIEIALASNYSEEILMVDAQTKELVVDEEERGRVNQAKVELRVCYREARRFRWLPELRNLWSRQEKGTLFEHQLFLKFAWDGFRIWQYTPDDPSYWAAFDLSVASIWSVENFERAGYSPKHAEKLSVAVRNFFEAQTGTRDMPATLAVRLDPDLLVDIDPESIGNFGDPGSYQYSRSEAEAMFGHLLESAYATYEHSQRAFESGHGWTANRWVMMIDGTRMVRAIEVLNPELAYFFVPSRMGIEGQAGWKITDPDRENGRNKFTRRDTALQDRVFEDLAGLRREIKIVEAHSLFANAALSSREITNRRLSRRDEELVGKCKRIARWRPGKNWRQVYAELDKAEKLVPLQAWLLNTPAFDHANKWALFGLVQTILRFGLAINLPGGESFPDYLPPEQLELCRKILTVVPGGVVDRIEPPATHALIGWLLSQTPKAARCIHADNAKEQPQQASATAAGALHGLDLSDLRNNQKVMEHTLRMLTARSAYGPALVIIARHDRLIDLDDLLEILAAAEQMIPELEDTLSLKGRVLPGEGSWSKVCLPLVMYDDSDHYTPLHPPYSSLVPAFTAVSLSILEFQQAFHQIIPLYGDDRFFAFQPWPLLAGAIRAVSPGIEHVLLAKWRAYWQGHGAEYADRLVEEFRRRWEENRGGFLKIAERGLSRSFVQQLEGLYDEFWSSLEPLLYDLGQELAGRAFSLKKEEE